MRSLRHILPFFLLISSSPLTKGQEELCPNYEEFDPLQECQTVPSYADLVILLETAPSGTQLDLCPFFLQKVETVAPALIRKGIQVRCVRRKKDDFCVISGQGFHLWIDTAEATLWQGFSFRNSNDHAVFISGETENSELAVHTFCHTSFLDNIRFKDTRGGSLMIEPSVGTVNVVETLFSENFSKTYGAGIYSRGGQLNVVGSVFVRNRSNGYGPAIYTAAGASLMIKESTFLSNLGRDRFDVVFNGGTIYVTLVL
jgi:predicted outer membrane repeat protein